MACLFEYWSWFYTHWKCWHHGFNIVHSVFAPVFQLSFLKTVLFSLFLHHGTKASVPPPPALTGERVHLTALCKWRRVVSMFHCLCPLLAVSPEFPGCFSKEKVKFYCFSCFLLLKTDRGHILVCFSKIHIESIWTNKMGLYCNLLYKSMPTKIKIKVAKKQIILICFIFFQMSCKFLGNLHSSFT